MAPKMIAINDIFDELIVENKRLSKELEVSKVVIKLLDNFRQNANQFNDNCICGRTVNQKNQLKELNTKFSEFIESVGQDFEDILSITPEISHQTNECQTIVPPQREVVNTLPVNVTQDSSDGIDIDIEIKSEAIDCVYSDISLGSNLVKVENSDSNTSSTQNNIVVEEVGDNQSLIRVIYKEKKKTKELIVSGFACNLDDCDFECRSKKKMSAHIETQHNQKEKLLQCNECRFRTPLKLNLIRHKNSHHKKDIGIKVKNKSQTNSEKEVNKQSVKRVSDTILEPLTEEHLERGTFKNKRQRKRDHIFKDRVKCLTNEEMQMNLNLTQDIILSKDDLKYKPMSKSVKELLETPQIHINSDIILNYFTKNLKTKKIKE